MTNFDREIFCLFFLLVQCHKLCTERCTIDVMLVKTAKLELKCVVVVETDSFVGLSNLNTEI